MASLCCCRLGAGKQCASLLLVSGGVGRIAPVLIMGLNLRHVFWFPARGTFCVEAGIWCLLPGGLLCPGPLFSPSLGLTRSGLCRNPAGKAHGLTPENLKMRKQKGAFFFYFKILPQNHLRLFLGWLLGSSNSRQEIALLLPISPSLGESTLITETFFGVLSPFSNNHT